MNKKENILVISLVFVVLAGIFALTIGTGKSSGDKQGVCEGKSGFTTTVHIRDSKVSNADVKGKLCDKISFVNDDPITREVAFGPHENHVPYDGVGEKILNQGQSLTITLDQTGKFHWHDHIHDEVEGYFTVAN